MSENLGFEKEETNEDEEMNANLSDSDRPFSAATPITQPQKIESSIDDGVSSESSKSSKVTETYSQP